MSGYDRRASGTPTNRLKEAETYLRQAEREIEKTGHIIHGLFSELALIAKHTHDKNQRMNYEYVEELRNRTDKMMKDLKTLADAYDEAVREFR